MAHMINCGFVDNDCFNLDFSSLSLTIEEQAKEIHQLITHSLEFYTFAKVKKNGIHE